MAGMSKMVCAKASSPPDSGWRSVARPWRRLGPNHRICGEELRGAPIWRAEPRRLEWEGVGARWGKLS